MDMRLWILLLVAGCAGGDTGPNDPNPDSNDDGARIDVGWGCDGDASISDWLFYIEVELISGELEADTLTCDVTQGGDLVDTMYPRWDGAMWYAEGWEDDVGVDCDRFNAINVDCE